MNAPVFAESISSPRALAEPQEMHEILEAFEAGLWLFWVCVREIIAVPRPTMLSWARRLHCTPSEPCFRRGQAPPGGRLPERR